MELGAFSVSLNVKDLQVSLAFYEKLGFTAYGPDYSEAGIPHRDMKIDLR